MSGLLITGMQFVAACIALAAIAASPAWAQSAGAIPVTLSVPGPGSSVSAPLELAVKLGLDREQGIALRLRFVDGGGVAIRDLQSSVAGFAVFGLPAALDANARGARLVALAAVDDLPLYTLVVRADLRGKVKRIADLAGRPVGIHSNSLSARTTSQQVLELLLRHHTVPSPGPSLIAAGQSWETQSAVLQSRSVDALMTDEPFATRLALEKLAFTFFSTGDAASIATLPGAGFLRATLVARREQVETRPDLAGRMVSTVQAALRWMAVRAPEEIADGLGLPPGPERRAFVETYRKYPRQYSRDGAFSAAQLKETESFFLVAGGVGAKADVVPIEAMVIDRWAGRKP